MATSMSTKVGGPSEGITSTSHQQPESTSSINTGSSSAVQDAAQPQQPLSAARRIFRNAAGIYRVGDSASSSSSSSNQNPPSMGRPSTMSAGIALASGQIATYGPGAAEHLERRLLNETATNNHNNKFASPSSASPAPSASTSVASSSSSSTSACSCASSSSHSRAESPITTPPTSAFSTTFPQGVREQEEDDCLLQIHGDEASRYTQDASGVLGLPKYLPRPDNVRDFDMTALEFDHQLKGIPCHYILDNLAVQGPALLQAITQTTVIVPSESTPLPPLLVTKYLGESTDIAQADYVLAISAKDTTRTLLLPVHGLVMSTNAKCLSELSKGLYIPQDVLEQYSVLPESEKIQVKREDEDSADCASYRTLPVVSLSLPSAAAFSLLVPFFYTSSSASLLASLLPLRSMPYPQSHLEGASPLSGLLNDTPNLLATRLSILEQNLLLEHANLIHSVWQTAVALGAGRDNLWKTLDIAWAVIVGALAIREQRKRS